MNLICSVSSVCISYHGGLIDPGGFGVIPSNILELKPEDSNGGLFRSSKCASQVSLRGKEVNSTDGKLELLTDMNSFLVLVDYQPSIFKGVGSRDKSLIMNAVVAAKSCEYP